MLASRGLSADVFRVILTEHDLVLAQAVLDEFQRIMSDKFGVPSRVVEEFIEELSLHEVVARVPLPPDLDVIRDPDDRHVVAAAIQGFADTLVTGDKDILDVRDRLPRLIVQTPREFWESGVRGGKWHSLIDKVYTRQSGSGLPARGRERR